MNTKKLLSLILASLLLLVSCSNKPQDESKADVGNESAAGKSESAVDEESIDPEAQDELPAGLKFTGSTFRLLASEGDGSSYISLTQEGLTGDVLNDEKYYMETNTEDRLDIEIEEITHDLWDLRDTYVNTLIMSGDTTFNAVSQWDSHAVTAATRNHCLPYDNLEYVDLTKKYWGAELSDSLAINGVNYFAIGSFNLGVYMKLGCIFMNKTLADAHQLEVPFNDVYEGTWTLEKLLSYGAIATNDENGDGVMDQSDAYTYGCGDTRPLAHQLWVGAGLKAVEQNADGVPEVKLFDNETFYDVLMLIKENFFGGPNMHDGWDPWDTGRQLIHFAKFDSNIRMRDVDIDYAILPFPKYTETQEEYYAHSNQTTGTYVLSNCVDTALTSATLEALSAYGYQKVIPAYLDSTLQDKTARDPQSKEMIQFIFDRRTIDLGETLLFDQFGDSAISGTMEKNANIIASWLQKMAKPSKNALARVLENLG